MFSQIFRSSRPADRHTHVVTSLFYHYIGFYRKNRNIRSKFCKETQLCSVAIPVNMNVELLSFQSASPQDIEQIVLSYGIK